MAAGTVNLRFDACLTPHRSLGRDGFALFMSILAALSLALSLACWRLGAWPIPAFLALNMVLVFIAFRINYRAGRMKEMVQLSEVELLVRRIDPRGYERSWRFQPYWVRLGKPDPDVPESQITLASHGRQITVGTFLSPPERVAFAAALEAELRRCREPVFDIPAQEPGGANPSTSAIA
jgi:uncharacterized membrane protein